MAYNNNNLALMNPGASKESVRLFSLVTSDAEATIDDANYISDGQNYGMRLNDLVYVVKDTGAQAELWKVTTATAGAAGVTISQAAVLT